MTITEQKAAQRKAGIAARRALSDTERTRSNAALCARIMALDCFKKAENILLYAAFGGEADLVAEGHLHHGLGKTVFHGPRRPDLAGQRQIMQLLPCRLDAICVRTGEQVNGMARFFELRRKHLAGFQRRNGERDRLRRFPKHQGRPRH